MQSKFLHFPFDSLGLITIIFFPRITTNPLTLRTSSFSESTKPLLETVVQSAQKSLLEASISTPLLMVESRSIQSSTIIEETSRANSEVNLSEKLVAEHPPERSSVGSASDLLTSEAAAVGDTDKSSSQSSLPVINVTSDMEDDNQMEDTVLEDIKEPTEDESTQTEVAEEVPEISKVHQIEAIVEHHEPPKEDLPDLLMPQQDSLEEELAEASVPGEQTLSEQNMPGVIRKLSIQSEEQHAAEAQPESDYEPGDSFMPGYVAPAPTPAPSMAPLAEIDQDPEDESDEAEAAKTVDAQGSEQPQQKKRKKKKDGASKKQEPAKGNLVCPWEDE